MDTPISLRVLSFKEGDIWIAQAIERDICVQAPDEDELVRRFELTLECEIRESEERGDTSFLESLPPAPKHFRDLWLSIESKQVRSFSFHGHDVDMAQCA